MSNSAKRDELKTNLSGRIDNLPFRASSQGLVPLFEAVSNAINAIRDTGEVAKGIVDIELQRDDAQQSFSEADQRYVTPIVSIKVVDNGIGFDRDHYGSFLLLDNVSERNFGTKGIGRLFWLKLFESVEVESHYLRDNQMMCRRFVFTKFGISDHVLNESAEQRPKTTVLLANTKPQYREHLKSRVVTVGHELVKHFLSLFLLDGCPKVHIRDEKDNQEINSELLPSFESKTIEIKGIPFQVSHVKTDFHEPPGHYVNYCAAARVVAREHVYSVVTGFPRKKIAIDGQSFYYNGYVTSPYLDKKVRSDRDGFQIEMKTTQIEMDSPLDWAAIKSGISASISEYLEVELDRFRTTRSETVRAVIDQDFPELQYLKTKDMVDFETMSLDASREEVGRRVSELHVGNQLSEKKAFREIIAKIESEKIESLEEFESRYEEDLRRLRTLNASSLAAYVIYRKHILDIFSALIGKLQDGKFETEKAVHSLIFPRKTKGEEVDYDEHNLWIVDDRWALFEYVASDVPLRDHKALVSDSLDRPDIVFYNLGFVRDHRESRHSCVAVIELKRPGRKDYTEDPIEQTYRYIDDIRSGKVRGRDGHAVSVLESDVVFHVYVICDVDNEAMQQAIRRHEFKPTFDGTGYRRPYHSNYNAMIEIVPFKKLLEDARIRNQIFFNKLGIGT